ncbi:MAG: Fic/DOC family N-terminal domain-containing protein, partial [Bacteroidota bacterium]
MLHINQFRAGRLHKSIGYQSFIPTIINDEWEWTDRELTRLIEKSAIAVGQLDAYSHQIPSIDLFIRMFVTKEATVSSRIEGTQTNLEEALLKESDIDPEKRNDWTEVNNYIRAMNMAIEGLPDLPLSSRLLRKAHEQLL